MNIRTVAETRTIRNHQLLKRYRGLNLKQRIYQPHQPHQRHQRHQRHQPHQQVTPNKYKIITRLLYI